jgi:ankyrin repeat protein
MSVPLTQSQLDARLRKHCAMGNTPRARKLLELKADSGALEIGSRNTSLHYAARNNHVDCVSLLLAFGAPVNAANALGWTPVMTSVVDSAGDSFGAEAKSVRREQCSAVLKVLIDGGGDVNHADANGSTALMFCAANGFLEAARTLLSRKADVNAIHSIGHTALTRASHQGNAGVVELLLDSNADASGTDNLGALALDYAARKGHLRCVQLLLDVQQLRQEDDVNHKKGNGYTPVLSAASKGHVAVVFALLDAKADVTQTYPTDLLLEFCRERRTDEGQVSAEGLFMLLCRNINVFESSAMQEKFGCQDALESAICHVKAVDLHVTLHRTLLVEVLSAHAKVDTRVGRGGRGLYQEPLERVLQYAGIATKLRVLNESLGLTESYLQLPQAAQYWYRNHYHAAATAPTRFV